MMASADAVSVTASATSKDEPLPIVTALNKLDVEEVAKLLEVSDDVLASYKYPRGLLQEAVLGFNASSRRDKPNKILKLLLDKGVLINTPDSKGMTALHVACCAQNTSPIIKELLAAGALVNSIAEHDKTPLHFAVLRCSLEDIKLLLEAKADVNAVDATGKTALHYAARLRHGADVIRILIQAGADVNRQCLVNNKPQGITPLHVAAKYGDDVMVKHMLQARARLDVMDSFGQMPVHLAAAYDLSGKVLAAILDVGVKGHVNQRDGTMQESPLHKAILHDVTDNVLFLLKNGANPNGVDARMNSCLHVAVRRSDSLHLWLALLEAGGDVEQLNLDQETPESLARSHGNKTALTAMVLRPMQRRRKSVKH